MRVDTYTDREAWLEGRSEGLGSSDAAIILGVGFSPGAEPYKSPFELWAEKTGKFEKVEREGESSRLRFGHLAEPLIAEQASAVLNEEGLGIYDPGDYTVATSTDYPWLKATVDRLVMGSSQVVEVDDPGLVSEAPFHLAQGPGELKTVEVYAQKDWDDEPSHYALVQVQQQMLVGGWDRAWVFAQIGFSTFKHYEVPANPRFQGVLLQEMAKFWSHVEADEPPAPDGTKGTARALRAMYPEHEVKSEVVLEGEAWLRIAQNLREAKARLGTAKYDVELGKHALMAAMGTCERAVIPGFDREFTWKKQKNKERIVAAFDSRPLKEAKPLKRETAGGDR